ncbi:carbohydrate kinase family protein [Mycetocola miduiensis]|uniref:Sugar or nucleoside kinase, ribokinase family n=1 Tax=Mycetocola miduiensis TaxID=995034 RepID=A0A1I4YFQ6_9MICO|nr:PfkB family carbohydrate kinase [Mycetocola miduiensis]SFN36440.1 Sugar or nucleoside kinase, ribokinase family [Mycetocola miduiensis]
MRRVVIAGHICVDITPGLLATTRIEPGRLFEVGALAMSLGGCVANTGGDLADLGLPVRVHTAVGDDELGSIVTRLIAQRPGMVGPPLVVSGANTSYSLVLEPPGVDRTFWHHTGANDRFDGTTVPLENCDLMHLGYPPLLPGLLVDHGAPLVALLERARAAGVTTSIDLAVVDRDSATGHLDWDTILRRMASATDVLSPSLDDLTSALGIDEPPGMALVSRLADQLIAWGAAVVMLSSGSGGLFLRTGSRERLAAGGSALSGLSELWADVRLEIPPVPVPEAVTTNGAGDAATAGLLYSIAAGVGPQEAGTIASACSAAVITGRPTTIDTLLELRPDLTSVLTVDPGGYPVR